MSLLDIQVDNIYILIIGAVVIWFIVDILLKKNFLGRCGKIESAPSFPIIGSVPFIISGKRS